MPQQAAPLTVFVSFGIELDDLAVAHAGEIGELARLRDERRRRALGGRPRFLVAAVLHAAIDLDAPRLRRRHADSAGC